VPVGGLIELRIDRPHVIGRVRPRPISQHRRLSQPLAFAPLARHAHTLLA
jgi:hypothetical protein